MITISGNPFDISAINGNYSESSIEKLVLNKISASHENYKYDNLDQLKFELNLRKEIAAAAKALNSSDFSFAVFHDSRCNPRYWNRTANGGFQLADGVKPGEAVSDIYENGGKYATECATAIQIVYYKALLAVYGEKLFDNLFTKIYLMNFSIAEPLLIDTGRMGKAADALIGDREYFENDDVDPKTPEWQGENVIVLPDSLYYGHGVGIAGADEIIRDLNATRKKDATKSAYLLDLAGRPNFKKLYAASQNFSAETSALVWRPFPEPLARL